MLVQGWMSWSSKLLSTRSMAISWFLFSQALFWRDMSDIRHDQSVAWNCKPGEWKESILVCSAGILQLALVRATTWHFDLGSIIQAKENQAIENHNITTHFENNKSSVPNTLYRIGLIGPTSPVSVAGTCFENQIRGCSSWWQLGLPWLQRKLTLVPYQCHQLTAATGSTYSNFVESRTLERHARNNNNKIILVLKSRRVFPCRKRPYLVLSVQWHATPHSSFSRTSCLFSCR